MKVNEMVNGETVEIRRHGESWWYVGTVIKARKLWVKLISAVDFDTAPPGKDEIADENTIAEWRRPN